MKSEAYSISGFDALGLRILFATYNTGNGIVLSLKSLNRVILNSVFGINRSVKDEDSDPLRRIFKESAIPNGGEASLFLRSWHYTHVLRRQGRARPHAGVRLRVDKHS